MSNIDIRHINIIVLTPDMCKFNVLPWQVAGEEHGHGAEQDGRAGQAGLLFLGCL